MTNLDARLVYLTLTLGLTVLSAHASADVLRPPAVPLVACDPYFSVWSAADRLTDADTTHWTGKPHRLRSMVRIDGTTYRVMGAEPVSVPAMEQIGLIVLPTRTVYNFQAGGVTLTLTFLTPALPEDLDVLSRPVTYLTYTMQAMDGKSHDVQVYFDAAAELAVNTPDQQVAWSRDQVGELATLKIGSTEQAVLAKRGDDIRIDWGYLYVAAPQADVVSYGIAKGDTLRSKFVADGIAGSLTDETRATAKAYAAAMVLPLGPVGAQPVSRWLMLAYDDVFSIQYMKHNLRPYWRRNGWDATDLLRASARDYPALQARCKAFDEALMADLKRARGEEYAMLCGLAFRQCFAAGKFVADDNGQPLQFCKENHSNGCIGTSDVFYPMAPQFLLFGPTLTKSFLVPFMNYAASERWKFPFAPHDLGQYPHANGQRYGGGERSEENQMPVEESGNLLILMAAVSQMDGNADFASLYWPQLQQWAEFLKTKGFDPENQLCTDDFAGHLAHNVNLSAKAICGLGSFAKMCEMRGEAAKAAEYRQCAREFADQWVNAADDGDHFRLAFDRPGTWSQKYNLVWDRILGLDLFPPEVLRKEMEFYKTMQNRYGLPLDNRQTYTKLDWVLWTATLTQDREDFQALVAPVFRFLNETPDRVPMTDWYFTDTGRRRGFTARPVVGGVFLQMLYDRPLWARYGKRAAAVANGDDIASGPTNNFVHLFSSFRGNGEDGLHLAFSHDGLKWTALNSDKPILRPQVGGKLMRDPCIIQGPHGVFHMVWTTSWQDSGIGIAHSKDLINWTEQQFVPVMGDEPAARNCWAPEITWDAEGKQYVLYWATTITDRFSETAKSGDDEWNHRMYCTSTRDFKTYTPTRLFYDPGFNVIDATIARSDDHYVMILKDETRHPPAKNLRIATSDNVAGPWSAASSPFTPQGVWVEGPSILKVGKSWLVYYDEYRRHQYGGMRTTDFKKWEDISDELAFPKGTRHGTAFSVSKDVLKGLLDAR